MGRVGSRPGSAGPRSTFRRSAALVVAMVGDVVGADDDDVSAVDRDRDRRGDDAAVAVVDLWRRS